MFGFKNGQRVKMKAFDKKATVTGEFDSKTMTQPMLLDGTSVETNYRVDLFENDVIPEEARPASVGVLGTPNRKTG